MEKILIITHSGIEDVSASEFLEFFHKLPVVGDMTLIGNVLSMDDIITFSYHAQSISKALLLIHEFKVSAGDDPSVLMDELISTSDISSFISKEATCRVSCIRLGSHDFTSHDILMACGEKIKEKYKVPITLGNADKEFFIFIKDNKGFFCYDPVRLDLSKRSYKIFASSKALKGVICYSLLKIAGYNKEKTLLDPFCGSGEIVIEAALFNQNKSPFYFDKKDFGSPLEKDRVMALLNKEDKLITEFKDSVIFALDPLMNNITQAKKNAKIAGVNDNIRFSRLQADWLDIKFDEKTIDCIVSVIPSPSKNKDDKIISKLYDELFYQADFILEKRGCMVVAVLKSDLLIERGIEKKFLVSEKRVVQTGKQSIDVVKLVRGTKGKSNNKKTK